MLRINTLNKSYKQNNVLSDTTLSIHDGELFSLVGVNGAGKTTLIKCVLDFIKPDAGDIFINETEHRKPGARADLAYLPERFLPPHYLNGRQFISYMLELHQHRYDDDKARSILKALDLSDRVLTAPVRQSSKGMAQKLGLAALFLTDKSFLVLDEPMSGLDPKARVLVKQQLKAQKAAGKTIFFSSHMLADVEELSDRLAILHEGKIVFCGTAEECKQRYQAPNLEQAFIHCIET